MKRLFNSCRKYREALCVAANGGLPPEDRAALEAHLKACTGCQKYRDEIGNVTTLLSTSRELFADLRPGKTAEARWAEDFESAAKPVCSTAAKIFQGFLDWSRDMVLPCRWIWTGVAAVWVVVLGLNMSQRTSEATQVTHRPSPEMIRALLALEGFLPGSSRAAQEPKIDAPGPVSPQPRSEHRPESKPS